MNLHDIAPALKHGDVPLWTAEEHDNYGELGGHMVDGWIENGYPLALWEERGGDLKFVIFVMEYKDFEQYPYMREAMDALARRERMTWEIWADHTLTPDRTPAFTAYNRRD